MALKSRCERGIVTQESQVQPVASDKSWREISCVGLSTWNLPPSMRQRPLKVVRHSQATCNWQGEDKHQIRSNQGFFIVFILINKWLLLLRVNNNISSSKSWRLKWHTLCASCPIKVWNDVFARVPIKGAINHLVSVTRAETEYQGEVGTWWISLKTWTIGQNRNVRASTTFIFLFSLSYCNSCFPFQECSFFWFPHDWLLPAIEISNIATSGGCIPNHPHP